EEKQKTEKERKNTKKKKIPTSVHFLLQSKKSRNRKNPKEKESRSSSIHTTAAEITEQERRDHQAQALTNSLILPKFTKAKIVEPGKNNNDHHGSKLDFDDPICETDDEEDIYSETDWMLRQEERSLQPYYESVESINLGSEEKRREVKIGGGLDPHEREQLIQLLTEYQDIFAWSYQDMPGLDERIVTHHLPMVEGCRPIKQKLRRMKPEWLIKIKEEVQK
ncbi:hypothetical protein LINPERPRIM_LOCUS23709, partial [Linum perenne]